MILISRKVVSKGKKSLINSIEKRVVQDCVCFVGGGGVWSKSVVCVMLCVWHLWLWIRRSLKVKGGSCVVIICKNNNNT